MEFRRHTHTVDMTENNKKHFHVLSRNKFCMYSSITYLVSKKIN